MLQSCATFLEYSGYAPSSPLTHGKNSSEIVYGCGHDAVCCGVLVERRKCPFSLRAISHGEQLDMSLNSFVPPSSCIFQAVTTMTW